MRKYVAQGKNYWVAAAGLVFSRSKYRLSCERSYNADYALRIGYVNAMLAV